MSLFFSPPLLNNQDQAQPNKNCTPGKYYFLFFLQDNSPLVFALHAVFSAPRWRNSSLLFDFLFLLDGVEPHSKNIILTAFSSSFVKYFPMWTKTKKKKSGGGGKKSRRGKRVAETQSWSCFQLQLFFSLPKFSGVFFFFTGEQKKNVIAHEKFPNLAVSAIDVVSLCRRDFFSMFIVVVPPVQWRRSGQGERGADDAFTSRAKCRDLWLHFERSNKGV